MGLLKKFQRNILRLPRPRGLRNNLKIDVAHL